MKKRSIAFLLSLVMLLSLLTPTALAEEPDQEGQATEETQPTTPTTPAEDGEETPGDPGEETPVPTDPANPGENDAETPDNGENGENGENQGEDAQEPADETPDYESMPAEELAALLDSLELNEAEEIYYSLSETKQAELEAYWDSLAQEEPEENVTNNGIVDFTDVAPFLEPVQGENVRNILMAAVMGVVGTYSDEEEKDNGIKLIKDATPNKDGSYTIRMEAYATGESVTTVVSEDVPTDIVLVLDQSGSMADCIVCGKTNKKQHTAEVYTREYSISKDRTYYCLLGGKYVEVEYCAGSSHSVYTHQESWVSTDLRDWGSPHQNFVKQYGAIMPKTSADGTGTQFYTRTRKTEDCTPRITALKDAATSFVDAVAEKAKGTNGKTVNHRVAVVGFASGASNLTQGFKNMEVSGDVTAVNNVINNLTADGGTLIDQGISTANSIFRANPIAAGTKRNRVMIVFTDGAPGLYGNWCSASVTTANNAIKNAQTAKKSTSDGGYGATVYTIGVFSGADASNPGALPAYTEYTEGYFGGEYAPSDENQIKNSNRFMHLVSSNYPNASNINTTGSINPNLNGSSYYLSAGDSDSLNSIFQQISDKINTDTSSTTLDANSVIKDVVTPYFTMPSGADVKVYTQNFGENGFDGTDAERPDLEETVDITGDTVSVTGFSFKDNWCGTKTDENGKVTYHGQKLIIVFKVTPKNEFLGGNNVPTNGENSGIYENKDAKDPVDTFPQPKVNVPVKDVTVTVDAAGKNVYYGNDSLTDADLRAGATATATAGNQQMDLWGNLGEMSDYVTVNTVVSKTFDGKSDGTYTITVTLEPEKAESTSKGTPAEATKGEKSAPIKVFKPVITWQDSAINMGETANYNGGGTTGVTQNFASAEWMHNGTVAIPAQMIGTEPALTYAYNPLQSASPKFTTDTYVTVTVKANDEVLPADVVTFVHVDDTDFKNCTFDKTKGQFIVHIKSFDLKIVKQGCQAIDENQSFIFEVTGPDGYQSTVTIQGNSSVTIKGLKVGTYTVTEKTAWSWRYAPEQTSYSVKPENVQNGEAIVTVKNDRNKTLWLNGCSWAVNNWGSGASFSQGTSNN